MIQLRWLGMNTHDKLSNEVHYYTSFARAFTVQAVVDFSVEVLAPSLIREYLLKDERFIVISRFHDTELFISKSVLAKWLIYVNIHLARNKLSQLTTKQLGFFLGSLIDADGHDEAMEVVTEFGKEFGLISFSDYSQEYVFPIAHILSFVKVRNEILLDSLTYAIDHVDIPFEKDADEILEKVLLELDSRERYILKARLGLFDGDRYTLLEIADILDLTRERVRQIEKSIYTRKVLFRPFLTALLQDILRRRGGLLFDTSLTEMNIRRLFARCLHIPVTNNSDLGLVIMGASNVSFDTRYPVLDIDYMIQWLSVSNTLCLIDTDYHSLAESVISYGQEKSKIVERIYVALRHIGKPAHYSTIWKVHNSLFPRNPNTEHNIHSALLRGQHGIVWIGAKGMFALTEWGFTKPQKTLLETATEIVKQRYAQSRRPVPYDAVVSEFKKHRKFINLSSLKMSLYNNPGLVLAGSDLFLPKDANIVSQRCSDGIQISSQKDLPESAIATNRARKSNTLRINRSFLDELTYREREVIKMRNGIDGTHYHSYEEIGRIFRAPIARVKEIEKEAISKLRTIAQNRIQG